MKRLVVLALACVISACQHLTTKEPGIGEHVPWDKIDGWQDDRQELAWPALLHSCQAKGGEKLWQPICAAALEIDKTIGTPDADRARQFFQTWFRAHRIYASGGDTEGLITGYYEPLLYGSKTPSGRYRFPLYQRPKSLLTIDLGSRFPDLKDARIRGRLAGNKVLPFYARKEIEQDRSLLAGNELLWLDDRDAVFFLHIQGSGRVQLPNGKVIGVGYSDQNGHVYKSIGKVLVDQGEMALKDVSLFTIKQWLIDNPEDAEDLLNKNPSYIFFVLREQPEKGPVGSLNVPLTPKRSIAIDPKLIDLGAPIWLSTHYPGNPELPLQQLVFAQDTGGAIKGHLRADLFWGHDKDAEQAAGTMKSPGSLMVLLPKNLPCAE